MAHVQKNTRLATGHLFDHYGRNATDEKYKYLYRSNDSIDPEKTYLNYNLAPQHDQMDFLKKRLSEVYCLKRKDVNIMCSWVVTAPKDLDPSQHKDFFKQTYNFLENRYGKENVISAYVHLDETTPHMHFAFVPVTYDKKKDRYKVSAKEVVTKLDLKSFHSDLQEHLDKAHIKCSILNEATKEGNKSIQELKRESATKTLHEIDEKTARAEKKIHDIDSRVRTLKIEYEARKGFMEEATRKCEAHFMYPSYVEVTSKGVFNKQEYVTVPKEKWEEKFISANQISAAERQMELFERNISHMKNLEKEISALRQKNKELNKNYKLLKDQGQAMFDVLQKHDLVPEANEKLKEIRHPAEKKVVKHTIKHKHIDMER